MSGSGTSIYGLIREENIVDGDSSKSKSIVKKYDGLQYFQCKFISKEDTVSDWY